MERLEIQEGTLVIGYRAFDGIVSLDAILPNSVQDIAARAFDDSGKVTFYAPMGSVAQGYSTMRQWNLKYSSDTPPSE